MKIFQTDSEWYDGEYIKTSAAKRHLRIAVWCSGVAGIFVGFCIGIGIGIGLFLTWIF